VNDASTKTRADTAQIRKRATWFAAIAAAIALVAGGFMRCGDATRSDVPESNQPSPMEPLPRLEAPTANSRVETAVAPLSSTEGGLSVVVTPEAGEDEIEQRPCKVAPIRGCAPARDERGCYRCTRCTRPFVYDSAAGSVAFSFTCPDMLNSPLYVDLSDTSDGPVDVLVSTEVDGHRSSKIMTSNLGSAFFEGFHGGTVQVTGTLRGCRNPSRNCVGALDVTVNARRDDLRR
jgi:hypothetical protein